MKSPHVPEILASLMDLDGSWCSTWSSSWFLNEFPINNSPAPKLPSISPPVLQVPRPERTSRYRAGTARRALQDQAWLVRSVAMRCDAVRWGLTTAGLSDAVGWSFNGSFIWGGHHKKKMQKKYTIWFQLGRVTYDLFGLELWGYYGMVILELWQWRFLSTKIDAQKLGGASSFMGPGGTPK